MLTHLLQRFFNGRKVAAWMISFLFLLMFLRCYAIDCELPDSWNTTFYMTCAVTLVLWVIHKLTAIF